MHLTLTAIQTNEDVPVQNGCKEETEYAEVHLSCLQMTMANHFAMFYRTG